MSDVTNPQPAPTTQPTLTLLLSTVLGRTIWDTAGRGIGRLSDILVGLREVGYPAVTGLVAHINGHELFVPAAEIRRWDDQRLELASVPSDLRPFARRPGEVLLRGDVLGHRLVDVEHTRLVTARDVRLSRTGDSWAVAALDIHPRGLLRRRGGHTWRDWSGFEALIGHDGSLPSRSRLGGLNRLKPAQLADIIEEASNRERHELLGRVHAHPDLEADVFEELEEDQANDLLEARPDDQIAGVLGRMRSDDAADALLDLPQDRRRAVLSLLPPTQREKITILLGYQEATAGGLMGVDFVSIPLTSSVADAIRAISEATHMQHEAIVIAFCHDAEQRLVGAVSLVALVQNSPTLSLHELADLKPVHVHPDADIAEITLAMADYNLLVLPVLDRDDHVIGVLTIDDVLEAAIAPEWRRRRG